MKCIAKDEEAECTSIRQPWNGPELIRNILATIANGNFSLNCRKIIQRTFDAGTNDLAGGKICP
jgi:hypothetical protein